MPLTRHSDEHPGHPNSRTGTVPRRCPAGRRRLPARGDRGPRRAGPFGRMDRALHRLRPVPDRGLPALRLQAERHDELLAPVDRAQLHELRRLPPREERPAERQAGDPVGQRLQLGTGLRRPDQRRPGARLGRVVEHLVLGRRVTSPTSRRWSRRTRSSCRRTTGAASSSGARSRERAASGPTASSTSRTRAPRSSTPTSTGPSPRPACSTPAPASAPRPRRSPRARRSRVQVSGRAGIPTGGIGTALLNVTVTAPAAAGYLTTYPSGADAPRVPQRLLRDRERRSASSSRPGSAPTARSGSTRRRRRTSSPRSSAGTPPPGTSSRSPRPACSTRAPVLGAAQVRVPAGGTVDLPVAGAGIVPSTGASAVVLDLSAVAPGAGGWLTAYPSGSALPPTAHVGYEVAGATTGMVVSRLGTGGSVTIHSTAETDLLVDVVGWFKTGADHVALAPTRLLDTRSGLGAPVGRVAAAGTTVAGARARPRRGAHRRRQRRVGHPDAGRSDPRRRP